MAADCRIIAIFASKYWALFGMDIAKAFEVAFNRKIEKNWEKIYVVVDIHDTIIRACYENEETYNYYLYSREALQLMTNREDICLILWSGCYDEKMAEYRRRFAEECIHFDYANENPEVATRVSRTSR